MSQPLVIRPIYLVPELGEYARLADGGIINAGGVAGPKFTVGGKPLLFADGTATDGTVVSSIHVDFQAAYGNSLNTAFVDFSPGKDFVLQSVNKKQFRFNADTGDVSITGNLVVVGSATTTINAAVASDRVAIHQTSGSYTPFIIEPRGGITPTVNVADIKVVAGGASVFTISATGTTYIKDLQTGLINGIDLSALNSKVIALQSSDLSAINAVGDALNKHTDLTDSKIKHTAKQISVRTDLLPNITGSNIQEAIESISSKLTAIAGNIRGYEHIQQVVSGIWIVNHGGNTKRIQITLWDSNDEQIFADTKIQDANTVVISLNPPITGRAILMLF
jgi:hypothetical protein